LLFAKIKIAFEIQKFCYTTKSEECPHAFQDYFDENAVLTVTTRNKTTIAPACVPKTKFGKLSLNYRCLKEWCTIPNEYKTIANFSNFKKIMFTYNLNLQIQKNTEKIVDCDFSCIDEVISRL